MVGAAALDYSKPATSPDPCSNGACSVNYTTPKSGATVKPKATTILFFKEDGCPYCAQEQPVINDIAKAHNVTTINLTSNPAGKNLTKEFNVTKTPTVIVLKNNTVTAQFNNTVPEANLTQAIE